MKEDLKEEVEVPEKVQISIDKGIFTVKGDKGECKKSLGRPSINIKQENNKVIFFAKKATRREKKLMYTLVAHLKNMIKGVQEPHVYILKICSGHFPMTVELKGKDLSVKNFFGEKIPRVSKIRDGVEVKIDGDKITITSVDIELAGQTAANLEQLTKIRDRDRRIFQDGIYITDKRGTPIRKG